MVGTTDSRAGLDTLGLSACRHRAISILSVRMAETAALSIIPATLAVVPRLVPLFDRYRQFYNIPPDESASQTFLQDRLSANESVIFLALAPLNGQPAPAGFIQLYPSFSSISLCRAWILNDLFVHPDFRCLGVGRALMSQAARHCADTGARQLWLQTDVTNIQAQRLYEACGMTRKEILEYTLAL